MNKPIVFAAGDAPQRSSATVNLSLGLVNIPLAVYSGLDDGIKVNRQKFTADGHPVGVLPYDKITGTVLTAAQAADVTTKATASDGTLVALTDAEIEAATGGSTASEILAFIPLSSIGVDYHVAAEAQLRPKKLDAGKKKIDSPGVVKAYALLCQAMAARQVAALFQVSLRGSPRWAALTPDGHMLSFHHAEEVRTEYEMPELTSEITDAERDFADKLIDSIGISTPAPVDEFSAKVQAFVDDKAVGVLAEPQVAVVAAPAAVDLMALLGASIEAAQAKSKPAKVKRTAKKAATAA